MSSTDDCAEVDGDPKVTHLIDEHRRLGARFAEFGGWEMPLWYAGAAAEHAAVRQAAGLFDIGHMGVIEIAGADALQFVEFVGTNAMLSLKVGRCRYTFLLNEAGLPLDDIIIYHVAEDRLLAVVNAVNARVVMRWLAAIAAGAMPLDPPGGARAREFNVALRDLTAPAAGDDRLTAMALQGPASADLLATLVTAAGGLPDLKRFGLAETELLGSAAILSSTGYTGEAVGYEIFVHPNAAPDLWRAILDTGAKRGVLPAGLAARDSLRIEAGLPLFGHELAGPHEITPPGAGYTRFVDFDRGFFIGREALLRREEERGGEIVRFRLDRKGARAIRAQDPVGSRRGQMVGWATSCAPVGDVQIGMAWVDRTMAREGTELLLYPARHLERSADPRDAAALRPGDRLPVHEPATVLPRFPR